MPALDLFLPMPPTTNNLYQTVVNPQTHRVMRQKTKAYEAWIELAGRAPLAGSWRRLVEDGEADPPWSLLLVVYGLPKNADLSNRLKAVEDLICMMTGLRDCNTMQIDLRKRPTHERLEACVSVWVATLPAEEGEAHGRTTHGKGGGRHAPSIQLRRRCPVNGGAGTGSAGQD